MLLLLVSKHYEAVLSSTNCYLRNSTYFRDAKEGTALIIPVSAISMACFISSFLYKDTMLDLGWFSRIKSFRRYLSSNFLNLEINKMQASINSYYIDQKKPPKNPKHKPVFTTISTTPGEKLSSSI